MLVSENTYRSPARRAHRAVQSPALSCPTLKASAYSAHELWQTMHCVRLWKVQTCSRLPPPTTLPGREW